VVVDESVLALTDYKLADPLDTFYFQRGDDVRNHHLREHVQLANADALISQIGKAQGGGGGGDRRAYRASAGRTREMAGEPLPSATPAPEAAIAIDGQLEEVAMVARASRDKKADEPIRARIDFNALAFFAASLPTDADGRAS